MTKMLNIRTDTKSTKVYIIACISIGCKRLWFETFVRLKIEKTRVYNALDNRYAFDLNGLLLIALNHPDFLAQRNAITAMDSIKLRRLSIKVGKDFFSQILIQFHFNCFV